MECVRSLLGGQGETESFSYSWDGAGTEGSTAYAHLTLAWGGPEEAAGMQPRCLWEGSRSNVFQVVLSVQAFVDVNQLSTQE